MGWHDALRGDDCEYRPASDGHIRCLPRATAFIDGYADAGCITRLAHASCAGAKYGIESVPLCPEYGYRIFALGAPYTGTHYYRVNQAGTCFQAGTIASTYPDYLNFIVGDEVPPSLFVVATPLVE